MTPTPQGFVPDDQSPELTEDMAQHLHCFRCGNDNAYELQSIEESISIGPNTVIVRVKAAFCMYCGERVMDLHNNYRLNEARTKLARGDVNAFKSVGVTYQVFEKDVA